MPGSIDDKRYLNLTGPFRALYRAARKAERGQVDDPPPAREEDPPDPIHATIRRQVEELLADADITPEQRREIFDSIPARAAAAPARALRSRSSRLRRPGSRTVASQPSGDPPAAASVALAARIFSDASTSTVSVAASHTTP